MSASTTPPSNERSTVKDKSSSLLSFKSIKAHQDAVSKGSFVAILPYELVSEIFAMLSMKQAIQCIQICQSWRSFILSWGGLWQELSDSACDFVHDLAPYKDFLQGKQVKSLSMHVRKRRKQTKAINFLRLHNCCNVQTGKPSSAYGSLLIYPSFESYKPICIADSREGTSCDCCN